MERFELQRRFLDDVDDGGVIASALDTLFFARVENLPVRNPVSAVPALARSLRRAGRIDVNRGSKEGRFRGLG